MAVFLAGWAAYVTPTLQRLFAFSATDPWRVVLNVFPGVVSFAVGYSALRLDGVRVRDVGLSWRHVRSGLLWFAGIVVGLNALVLLVAVATGGRMTWSYTGLSPVLLAVYVAVNWVFVGIAEELVARAYMQNKLVALLGGGQARFRRGVAILVAAVLFALWHIPQRLLVVGLEVPQLSANLLLLVVAGLAFGVVYEATRNVVLVGLLHGAYNFAPLLMNVRYTGGQSAGLQLLLLLALGGPVLAGVWAYRRWARDRRTTDFRPQVAA